MTLLLLRIVAIARTKFWEGKKLGTLGFPRWSPNGFTVQFTLSLIKQEPHGEVVNKKAKGVDTQSGAEEGRLIET